METKQEGFDRANAQGKNHDTEGNIANVGNDQLKQNVSDNDLAKKVPTVTPYDNDEVSEAGQNSSNKGQGPSGENL
ncbi:hypothetical protein [Mucilaginibacter segetis]|uniref:Uncharacterized protein n=1 Tax=Mucilaginibacter segetis TaxID=2793071 RepID=A0A934PTL7_9SPHI|nr:hypothetical protein [Mucilaginibacter segetis]MBK0379185.1 hypothetical protein [Mucilaginibacter segetis]